MESGKPQFPPPIYPIKKQSKDSLKIIHHIHTPSDSPTAHESILVATVIIQCVWMLLCMYSC